MLAEFTSANQAWAEKNELHVYNKARLPWGITLAGSSVNTRLVGNPLCRQTSWLISTPSPPHTGPHYQHLYQYHKIQILTREHVPTQLNVLTYFYDYHSHHITCAVQDDKLREFFLSIHKFKNICIDKMANVFIHNLGSPVGKGWDIDDVWMFDL